MDGGGWGVSQSLVEGWRGWGAGTGQESVSTALLGCPDSLRCVEAPSPPPPPRAISGLGVLSCDLLFCRVTAVWDVTLLGTFPVIERVLSWPMSRLCCSCPASLPQPTHRRLLGGSGGDRQQLRASREMSPPSPRWHRRELCTPGACLRLRSLGSIPGLAGHGPSWVAPSGWHRGPFSFPPFLLDHRQVGAVQGLTALSLSFLICKMGL